jgi:hypothetical protein
MASALCGDCGKQPAMDGDYLCRECRGLPKPMTANHALLCGNVLGTLWKHLPVEFKAEPLIENGEYTNQIRVYRPSGSYIITVEEE